MALALAYQQRNRPNLGDLSPEQVTAMQAPTQQPTMSLLDRISETGAGIGKGLANTVEGMGQMVTAPIETGKEMYRNVSDVVSNPSLIADALKQMGEKATSSPAGFGEVVGENINPRNLAKTLAKGLAKPVMQELIVAHGTPHRFPPTENNPLGEFDASKMGTGEGAQAYGHGHYLAENPDVAGEYQKIISSDGFLVGDKVFDPSILQHLNVKTLARKGDVDAAIAKAKEIVNSNSPVAKMAADDLEKLQAIKAAGGMKPNKGSLYTVDLPDEKIAQMLDYDLSFSQQSDRVKEALLKMYPSRIPKTLEYYKTDDLPMSQLLHHLGNDAVLAKHLQKEGIPGIKYFDEGSRNTSGKWIAKHPQGGENAFNTEAELNAYIKRNPEYAAVNPKQTRNFVVFPGEEKHLKILERK